VRRLRLLEISGVLVRFDHVVCCIATTESRFVWRADEKLTAFVELGSQLAVKGMAF
jgi:hypothetical protein